MPRKHQPKAVTVPVVDTPTPYRKPERGHDVGASLYKDRSGPHRGQGLSEGKDNFGAITHEAHKTVALAAQPEEG